MLASLFKQFGLFLLDLLTIPAVIGLLAAPQRFLGLMLLLTQKERGWQSDQRCSFLGKNCQKRKFDSKFSLQSSDFHSMVWLCVLLALIDFLSLPAFALVLGTLYRLPVLAKSVAAKWKQNPDIILAETSQNMIWWQAWQVLYDLSAILCGLVCIGTVFPAVWLAWYVSPDRFCKKKAQKRQQKSLTFVSLYFRQWKDAEKRPKNWKEWRPVVCLAALWVIPATLGSPLLVRETFLPKAQQYKKKPKKRSKISLSFFSCH